MMKDFPSPQELLARFVSRPTVNGGERPLALDIARLARGLGMEAVVQDLGDDRANVYAHIGQGPCLLLCGHLDVVPAEGEWASDPFTLAQAGECYVGRGCVDMKGAIAAMLYAAARQIQKGLPGMRLALLFVADEESGNLGMKHFLKMLPFPVDACVIGEPTELEVAVAHKGMARFFVELFGKAAHASLPDAGVNALTLAARAILALEAENQKLAADLHPLLPPRTVCVTMARGGERENILPGYAELLVDLRLFPGDTEKTAADTLRRALWPLKGKDFSHSLRPHRYLPGGGLAPDHPWVQAACRLTGRARGRGCSPVEFRASCEQALMLL